MVAYVPATDETRVRFPAGVRHAFASRAILITSAILRDSLLSISTSHLGSRVITLPVRCRTTCLGL